MSQTYACYACNHAYPTIAQALQCAHGHNTPGAAKPILTRLPIGTKPPLTTNALPLPLAPDDWPPERRRRGLLRLWEHTMRAMFEERLKELRREIY